MLNKDFFAVTSVYASEFSQLLQDAGINRSEDEKRKSDKREFLLPFATSVVPAELGSSIEMHWWMNDFSYPFIVSTTDILLKMASITHKKCRNKMWLLLNQWILCGALHYMDCITQRSEAQKDFLKARQQISCDELNPPQIHHWFEFCSVADNDEGHSLKEI